MSKQSESPSRFTPKIPLPGGYKILINRKRVVGIKIVSHNLCRLGGKLSTRKHGGGPKEQQDVSQDLYPPAPFRSNLNLLHLVGMGLVVMP